jgi:hypothetical protein
VDQDPPSPRESPRLRKISVLSPLAETFSSTEVASPGAKNPLSKLFGAARDDHQPADVDDTAVMKMENLQETRDLPVQRLRDEMKELQVRHKVFILFRYRLV